jgi:hypothetical protein
VGGFDYIPAQSERSIDAEAGMVWDATGGPFNNRIYLVYTEEPVNESNDTEIYVRTSTDDGGTWTAPVRVNDDPLGPIRSQFLPYIVLDHTTGTVAVGFHDCRNDNGVPGPGGTNNIPNDDAEYYGTYSTDGGATWATNVRLSGGFSNATASGNGIDFGDYVGLDAHAGKLYTVWADNANCDGTNPNGTLHAFDLYTNTLMLPTPPVPSSAVSRKVHGAAGTFDVPLPLTGNVGVECRSGGATNDYQMIINFANSVTVGSASVTSGTGSVSSFSVSGSQVTVNLTGVTNVQRITVALINVNDGTHMGNVPILMGVLVGDTTGNGIVNAGDVSLTKSQVGATVTSSNFREDVNANGTISSTDVAIVKSDVGTSLPP